MKKLTLLLSLLFLALGLMAQTAADSTAASNISTTFGLEYSTVLYIIGGLSWVIGHFAVKGKWYSYTQWLEKALFSAYTSVKWFNDKTNRK